MARLRLTLCMCLILPVVILNAQQITAQPGGGQVRMYYVAADEVEWDYAPTGINHMTGKPFRGLCKGPHGTRPAPHRHQVLEGRLPRIH